MVLKNFIYIAAMEKHIENRLMDMGRGEERVRCMERVTGNLHSVQFSRSVVRDSLRPHGLQPSRLLYPWDFPGKSTGVGCDCLLR